MGQRELDELHRLISTKDQENDAVRSKVLALRGKNEEVEAEYQRVREQNDEILRLARFSKEDIGELHAKVEQEKDRRLEMKGQKDKAEHHLYRVMDEFDQLRNKQDQLQRGLGERS